MSALYRGVLSCYPRWWREQRGDEVLGVLQESADQRGHDDPRDLLNLAVHGIRLRLGPAGAAGPGRQVLDRVSVVAMALLSTVCVTLLVFGEWAPWDPQSSFGHTPIGNLTTGSISYLAGLLALVAAVAGRSTLARGLAAFATVSALVMMAPPVDQLIMDQGFARPPGIHLLYVAALGGLASLGTPRPPRDSRALLALMAAVPTGAALFLTARSLGHESWFYYRSPYQEALRANGGMLLGIALAVIAIVLVIGGRRTWAAAIAANSMPWLLLSYVDLRRGGVGQLSSNGVGLLATVVALALLLGLIAIRISRRRQPAGNSVASTE